MSRWIAGSQHSSAGWLLSPCCMLELDEGRDAAAPLHHGTFPPRNLEIRDIRPRCKKAQDVILARNSKPSSLPLPRHSFNAGRTVPEHAPNPTSPPSSVPHTPVKVTVSPSSRNVRCSPLLSSTITLPPCVCSSKHPQLPGSVPEIVPEPRRSPTLNGQPPIVWCASI